MPFTFKPTKIPDVIIVEPQVFVDERGFFMESYKDSEFLANGISYKFKQDNLSYSKKNVLRGMHYQLQPKTQGKLLQVMKGKIWDVVVDLRKNSLYFKQWVGVELSEHNHLGFFFPPGFAHGFMVLSEDALVLYKSTEEYAHELERGIKWNDAEIGITWPTQNPIIKDRDNNFPFVKAAEVFE